MKKPIIGILSSITYQTEAPFKGLPFISLSQDYAKAVQLAGAIPFVIPLTFERPFFKDQLSLLNGLVLSGGYDVDPRFYGEEPHPLLEKTMKERDLFELEAVKLARELSLPILGICRGLQLINVAFGGTLHQDLSLADGAEKIHRHHCPKENFSHTVKVDPSSLLFTAIKKRDLHVNSYHHQGIKTLGKELKIAAVTQDGIIEAVEFPGKAPIMAVQWHPEMMVESDPDSQAIFNHFVRLSSQNELHA